MYDIELLYPDLQKTDGLPHALQSALALSDSTLKIQGKNFSELRKVMEFREDDVFYHLPTKVISTRSRWVDVDVALERRLFILMMGEKEDIEQAFLETDSLPNALAVVQAWLIDHVSVSQLKNIDPTANLLDLGDEVQYIRSQWARRYRQAVNSGIFTRLLAPVFARAMQDPILSQLTPYTSHDTLYLSRYIEFPFSNAGLPLCAPLLNISLDNYCRRIIRNKLVEQAQEFLQAMPPEFELILNPTPNEYELRDIRDQIIGRGNVLTILGLIWEYTHEKFEVFSNKTRVGVGDAELAIKLMREAIPENTGRAVRHSGEE
jgi:hypothetical protein